MITCIYIISCWLKRLAVPEHLSRPSEMTLQTLSVSSEKPMRLVIVTVLQLAHSLAHTHILYAHNPECNERHCCGERVRSHNCHCPWPQLQSVSCVCIYIANVCSKQADLYTCTSEWLIVYLLCGTVTV